MNEAFFQCLDDFVGVGHDAPQAAEMFHGYASVHSGPDVEHHLAGIDFHDEYAFHML